MDGGQDALFVSWWAGLGRRRCHGLFLWKPRAPLSDTSVNHAAVSSAYVDCSEEEESVGGAAGAFITLDGSDDDSGGRYPLPGRPLGGPLCNP